MQHWKIVPRQNFPSGLQVPHFTEAQSVIDGLHGFYQGSRQEGRIETAASSSWQPAQLQHPIEPLRPGSPLVV